VLPHPRAALALSARPTDAEVGLLGRDRPCSISAHVPSNVLISCHKRLRRMAKALAFWTAAKVRLGAALAVRRSSATDAGMAKSESEGSARSQAQRRTGGMRSVASRELSTHLEASLVGAGRGSFASY